MADYQLAIIRKRADKQIQDEIKRKEQLIEPPTYNQVQEGARPDKQKTVEWLYKHEPLAGK